MKLGVSYNLFDTEELLESSIQSIRDEVDYVHVLYQTISNCKNPCSPQLLETVEKLKADGLIDDLEKYEPDLEKGTHWNEIRKRNIGLERAKYAKCTYFLSMDSDEYYEAQKLRAVKGLIEKEKITSMACEVVNYFKKPTYQLVYPNQPQHYVSAIFKIRPWIKYKLHQKFPVLVDPTRRMHPGKFMLFKRDELTMHHMTLIRKNIRSKLENSSANKLYERNNINKYVEYFENWKLSDAVYPPSNYENMLEIVKVQNLFNVPLFD